MKKQMSILCKNKLFLRSILAVLCVAVVMLGGSFTSYAQNGTVNRSDVNIRQEAGTGGTPVGSVTTNDVVEILGETMGADGYVWYNIKTSTGVTGYIRSDFITKTVNTNPPAEQEEEEEEEPETQTPATQVTDTEDKTAYVKGTSSVNIRQDASTSSGRVASARGGSQITIVGEATGADGYKWYKVEFVGNGAEMTGFIRSDLITFEAPVQDPEVTEIEGEAGNSEEPSEAPSESVEEPGEAPSEPEETGPSVSDNRSQFVVMEPESYLENVPEGFTEIDFAVGDNSYTAWEKGSFYILYASVDGGTPKFYLYDYVTGGYVTYADLFSAEDAATVEDATEGINFKLIAIICGAVALILLIVVIILSYKLANAGYEDDNYDDDDDYYEDDDEDDDDEMISLDAEDDMDVPVVNMPEQKAAISATSTVIIPVADERENDREAYVPEKSEDSEVYDDEEDISPKSSAKKEKKSFGKKFLDYFTVEVEDEDDDDEYDDEDDYDDDDEEYEVKPKKSSGKSKSEKSFHSYIDDDDDDDLNFIDL